MRSERAQLGVAQVRHLAVVVRVVPRGQRERDLQHVPVGDEHHGRVGGERVGRPERREHARGDLGDGLDPVLVRLPGAVPRPDALVGGRGALVVRAEAALAQALVDPRRPCAETGGELLGGLACAGEVARDDDRARTEALRGRIRRRGARLLPAATGQPHRLERPRAGDGHDPPLDVRGGLPVPQHEDGMRGLHRRSPAQEGTTFPGLRFRPGSVSAKSPCTMRVPTSPMSSVIQG